MLLILVCVCIVIVFVFFCIQMEIAWKKDDAHSSFASPPSHYIGDYDVPPSVYSPLHKISTEAGLVKDADCEDVSKTPELSSQIYDTPPSSKRSSRERTLPKSARSSKDSSSTSGKLVVDHLYKQLFSQPYENVSASYESLSHYDTPPGSKRSSLENILSADNLPTYDIPVPSARALSAENMYDVPNPSAASSPIHSQDCTNARASVMSTMSCDSGKTPSRCTSSFPNSARSSADASWQESCSLSTMDTCHCKQRSIDSGLGIYDTPVPGQSPSSSVQPPPLTASPFHLPHLNTIRHDGPYVKRSRSVENVLDNVYDTPQNNTLKAKMNSSNTDISVKSSISQVVSPMSGVPSNTTQNKSLSTQPDSCHDNTTPNKSLSTQPDSCHDSTTTPTCQSKVDNFNGDDIWPMDYEELILDRCSALQFLSQVYGDVKQSISQLLSQMTSTWNNNESINSNICNIRISCLDVKGNLSKLVDFIHTAIEHSVRISDNELGKDLLRQLNLIQHYLRNISNSIQYLEHQQWSASLLVESSLAGISGYMGAITSSAEKVLPAIEKVSFFIQSKSDLLFKPCSDSVADVRDRKCSVYERPGLSKPDFCIEASVGFEVGVGSVIYRPRTVPQRPLPALPISLTNTGSSEPVQRNQSRDLARGVPRFVHSCTLTLETAQPPCAPSLTAHQVTDIQASDGQFNNGQPSVGQVSLNGGSGDDLRNLREDYDYIELEEGGTVVYPNSEKKLCGGVEVGDSYSETNSETSVDRIIENVNSIEINERTSPQHSFSTCPHTVQSPPDICTVDKKAPADFLGPSVTASLAAPPIGLKANRLLTKLSNDELSGCGDDLSNQTSFTSNVLTHRQAWTSDIVDVESDTSVGSNEKQVLCYYSGKLDAHFNMLENAIDAFLQCVDNGEPPNVFISHSKFVIVTAHKLVFIADSLHRSLSICEVRNKLTHCAGELCRCLKASVQATKLAAVQFPSVPANQEMVNRIFDISRAVRILRALIVQASAL